jgi:spermidine/putrescine transport system substrate-binding protein
MRVRRSPARDSRSTGDHQERYELASLPGRTKKEGAQMRPAMWSRSDGTPRTPRFLALLATFVLVATACREPAPSEPGEPAGAAFPESSPAEEDAGPLRLLEWAGYEIPAFHQPFAEQFGDAQLEFEFADSGANFFSKAATGAADVDIAHPCSNWVTQWKDAGLIAPIDVDRLSNWQQLDPGMRELGRVDGQYWFVPWDWGYDAPIVATDQVEEVPDSWRDFWDPQYRDRISMIDYSENAVAITAWAFGLDYPNLSDEELEFVKEKLLELKENVKTFWQSSTDLVQQMTSGEVDIGYGWPDQYAKVVDAGVDATYVEPKEGRNGWVCGFVVLADTQHYDLAIEYIDSAISQEVGRGVVNKYFLGHSNVEAIETADQEIVQQLQYDDTDIRERTHFAVPLTFTQRETFNRIWNEVLAAG